MTSTRSRLYTELTDFELGLQQTARQQFFNRHPLRVHQLLDDPGNLGDHPRAYIDGYSSLARHVMQKFEFDKQIDRLKAPNLLYRVIARVREVNLHPDRMADAEMGAIFEASIPRFAKARRTRAAGDGMEPDGADVLELAGEMVAEAGREAGHGRDRAEAGGMRDGGAH